MNSEKYFEILSNVKNFPSIPETARKLDEALKDPESDIDKVAHVVMQDPTLTAKLVRISNSSFFALRERVTSVQKAISILGLNLIKELTMSTSVMSFFSGSKRDQKREEFWKHCVAVAICAKLVSRDYACSIAQQEELYTIGLIHDIGKLVTETYFPSEHDAIMNFVAQENCFYWEAEQKILGLTHAETGRWVAHNWNFDEKIINTIAYHHAIEAGFTFVSERGKLFISIIHLADTIVKDLKYGNSGDMKLPALNQEACDFLNLTKAKTKEYIDTLKKQLTDIDDFLTAHFG